MARARLPLLCALLAQALPTVINALLEGPVHHGLLRAAPPGALAGATAAGRIAITIRMVIL